jgi:hypothetical protein
MDALDWRQEEEEDLENAKEEEDEDEWVKKSERKWMLEERRRRRKLCITGCLTKSSMLISKKKPVRSAFLTLNVFLTVNIRNDVSRLKFNNIREVIIIIQKT